jgi:hypothetical protein
MSGIEGVNGLESDSILEFLQEVSRSNKSTERSKNSQTSGLGSVSDITAGNDEGVDSLKSKIDAAVTEAINKLDKSSSFTEIMDAIKTAVDSTLKANGVDPESMKNKMPPEDGQGAPPMPPKDGPNDEFRNKIDELLEENGFDVEKLRSEMMSSTTATSDDQSSILEFLKKLKNQQGVDTEA